MVTPAQCAAIRDFGSCCAITGTGSPSGNRPSLMPASTSAFDGSGTPSQRAVISRSTSALSLSIALDSGLRSVPRLKAGSSVRDSARAVVSRSWAFDVHNHVLAGKQLGQAHDQFIGYAAEHDVCHGFPLL